MPPTLTSILSLPFVPRALTVIDVPPPPPLVVVEPPPLVVVVLVELAVVVVEPPPPQLMEAEPEPHQTVAQLAPLTDTVIVPLPPP